MEVGWWQFRSAEVMLVMVMRIVGSLRIRKHLETGRSFYCNVME